MRDHFYMQEAIKEARKAFKGGDVPVGCVIVIDDKIVARSHNLRHKHKNSIYHAEMLAIDKACKKLDRWILDDATIYVTLEPCLMCSGAILQSRFKKLVYGLKEPKSGCVESVMKVFEDYKFNHTVEVVNKLCEDEISEMMKSFFQNLRESKKINI